MNDISQAVKDIESEYKRLGDERKNNLACYRHDIFAKREWNDLEQPVYAWQWNFSQAEYDGIKTLLTKYSNEIPEIIQQSSICCKLIQLYISEWYKREYNGNDSNNAFKSIGVGIYSTLAEKICRKLGIDDKKVYKSRNVNGQEEGQNEWLYTIYVDGGLPLTYLSNKSKANDIKNTIYEIICEKDNENALEFIGDDLGDLCRNGVINQSYQARNLYPEDKDASIYDFIQEFILTENLKIDGFDNFHDIIRNAKQRVTDDKKKKFEVRVRAFKIGSYFILSPQLYLRPEPNGSNYAISQERLKAWGIDPQSNPFELQIKCGDKKLWEEYYEKCIDIDGSYITRSRRITYDLPKVKETLSLLAMPWKLVFKQGDNSVLINEAIENKMEEQGYLQMYNGDFYTWSSKSSNNYDCSAILYYKAVVNLNDNQHTEEPVSDSQYGWVEFDESIQLEIGSKIITKYCKAGQLIVDFGQKPNPSQKEKEKHLLSKYHNGLDVKNNKRLALIYVGLKLEFDVQISKDSFGEIISKSIPSKDIVFEYRKGANGVYQPLNPQSINAVGYYELKLTYSKTRKYVIIPCFALDRKADVSSVFGNNPRTDFQYFGGVSISYIDNNNVATPLIYNNGIFKKHWTNQLNYINPFATYQVDDGVSAFELRIPQPIDAIIACDKRTDKIIFTGNGVGRNSSVKPTNLPILFADRFNFYQLPNKVLYTGYDPVDGWTQAFDAIRNYVFRDNRLLSNNGKSYFQVQTFTHSTYEYDDCIPTGLRQSDFNFVLIKSPMGRKTIRLNSAGKFDFSGIGNTDGIIVQQIDSHNPPQSIIKPIYVPGVGNGQGMNEKDKRKARNTRIGGYHQSYTQSLRPSVDLQGAIDYFKIAIETGMYFGSFDALLGLVMNCVYKNYEYSLIPSPSVPKILAKFYHQYYDDCINNGIRVNYDALWRLADEFLFDWTLIPRYDWVNEFSKNWAAVTQLFGYRYLNSGTDSLAQWLHGGYTTYMLTKSIPPKNNEWNIYVRTITGQYGSGRNSQSQADFWSLDFARRVPVMKLLHNKEKHNEITII